MLKAANNDPVSVSVIIPTFNGAARIRHCLDALLQQTTGREIEIFVVDDGSTDETAGVVQGYPKVRLIRQSNAGPAAARNRGASEARGEIVLFTDDDCVPTPNWVEAMLAPFADSDCVGVKGVYRTRQTQIAARFVQIEYEDRYRLMAGLSSIDFVDTYSAGFRRDRFLEMKGYDTSFPLACAEDIELSYRMSAQGWEMKFAPNAVVYHTHPDALARYLKKKYKFAFWRVLAVRKNPTKAIKDSHTPQLMKIQLLFGPALVVAAVFDSATRTAVPASFLVLAAFFLSTLPFTLRAIRKDTLVGLVSPAFLAARSFAQALGVCAGIFHAYRTPIELPNNSAA
jgi:glycosyltransferase involved in cell wall biosynthesis